MYARNAYFLYDCEGDEHEQHPPDKAPPACFTQATCYNLVIVIFNDVLPNTDTE
jgi:hypothetical protein